MPGAVTFEKHADINVSIYVRRRKPSSRENPGECRSCEWV